MTKSPSTVPRPNGVATVPLYSVHRPISAGPDKSARAGPAIGSAAKELRKSLIVQGAAPDVVPAPIAFAVAMKASMAPSSSVFGRAMSNRSVDGASMGNSPKETICSVG